MTPPPALPYARSTFAAATAAWPGLHPVQAAMRAMGSGDRPDFTVADLRARRDRELLWWRGLPGAGAIRARIRRRYDAAIAVAERKAQRAARSLRIAAALDRVETALPAAPDAPA